MAKWYEIEIQRNKNGEEARGIYAYDTLEEAKATFHNKQWAGISNPDLVYVFNMVMNEQGGMEVSDTLDRNAE